MSRPVGQTDPAKLMFALAASHVIATLALLDCHLAFRTISCVKEDPSVCLGTGSVR